MTDAEFAVLEACCASAPQFAIDFEDEVLRTIVDRNVSVLTRSWGLGRITKIARALENTDARLEKLAEIALISAIDDGIAKLSHIDELAVALTEDYTANASWAMALFAELIELGKFSSPSVLHFIRVYAERADISDCEAPFDDLCQILEGGGEDAKTVGPVVVELLQARKELRERFVARGTLDNEVIGQWDGELIAELRRMAGQ
jgi:hypothetical protein